MHAAVHAETNDYAVRVLGLQVQVVVVMVASSCLYSTLFVMKPQLPSMLIIKLYLCSNNA